MQANRNDGLNLWQRVSVEALWWLCRIFSVLPYVVRYYVLLDIIYFFVYHCFRYRVGIVTDNLRNSFPEKDDRAIRRLRRKYYRQLAEMFINTISMAGMSDERFMRHIRFNNIGEWVADIDSRNAVTLTSHFGFWEYYGAWGLYAGSYELLSVYHPLTNRVFDEFYKRLRRHGNAVVIPMQSVIRFYLRHRDTGCDGRRMMLGLIADQRPQRRPDSIWIRFLNQDTIFFDGGEALALRFGLPVYYCRQRKIRRGYYEADFERIYDGCEKVGRGEIMRRYAACLERDIKQTPELWMWSHRRWKHKRPTA